MNENINITVPKEVLGGKTVNKIDHGPFYFFTPALPVHRVNYRDSVPHVRPCVVTPCTDWVEHLPEEQCPDGTVIQRSEFIDQVGTRIKIGMSLIPADPIRQSILDAYSPWGLKEIQAFVHKSEEEIDLSLFNRIIYPEPIEPNQDFNSETATEIARVGGLQVRRKLVETGANFISSSAFGNEYGAERQKLYKNAAVEALASFVDATRYVTSELNNSDAEIRLRLANAGGKPTYDTRDSYMQWLLARSPIMESQNTQAQVVVQMPEGFNQGQGLSKEDLLEVMIKAQEHAMGAVAQQASVKPAKVVKERAKE